MAIVQSEPKKIYIFVDEIDTPGVYYNADSGLISFSSDGQNWITIADKNLGATQVYHNGDTVTASNSGGYFQWGNNYMFPYATGGSGHQVATTVKQIDASSYGPNNPFSGDEYFYSGNTQSTYKRRDTSNNPNLWGETDDTAIARKGPCPEGFHIWSYAEIQLIKTTIESITGYDWHSFGTNLQILTIPPAGQIWWTTYTPRYKGTYFGYWTSSPYHGIGYDANYYGAQLSSYDPICGFNIRPMKNIPVIPNSTRTVLYQPS